ncbi:MAG: DUF2520 domain-containing protein [Saprospiraceae bacterium]|nr:DUF2520 domain-containing protein [Saprospiraceae bacterium]
MDICIIGSGNMARQLLPALQRAGLVVSGLYGRNLETSSALSAQYQLPLISSLKEINSDVAFLCVSDDAIAGIAAEMSNYKGLVIHTSGSVPSTVLSAFTNYGVLYPVQTMTKQGRVNFEKVPLCITGSDASTLDTLNTLAGLVSQKVYTIDDEQRKKVHLAAVMTNNFINHLVVVAKDYLLENQLDYEIIVPLLRTTMEKLTQAPYNFQQTGPAVRNDEGVISRHLELLKSKPELHTLYETITESIQSHAHH